MFSIQAAGQRPDFPAPQMFFGLFLANFLPKRHVYGQANMNTTNATTRKFAPARPHRYSPGLVPFLALCATLALGLTARAASITWGTPTTPAGDTDVSTTGDA